MTRKSIIKVAMAFIMVLAMLPTLSLVTRAMMLPEGETPSVLITSSISLSDWEWNNVNGGITITGYGGNQAHVVIPDMINDIPVTALDHWTFNDGRGIVSITIPHTITSIGRGAFLMKESKTFAEIMVDSANSHFISENGVLFSKDKTMLIRHPSAKSGTYTIPNSVTHLEDYAFIGFSGLTNINLPSNLIHIGWDAFSGCSGLTSLSLPSNVKYIGGYAFDNCSRLSSIVIPSGVTEILDRAFWKCTSLREIVIPSGIIKIDENAFLDCINLSIARFEHMDGTPIDINTTAFMNVSPDFKIIYPAKATGFTTPTWKGYPAFPDNNDEPKTTPTPTPTSTSTPKPTTTPTTDEETEPTPTETPVPTPTPPATPNPNDPPSNITLTLNDTSVGVSIDWTPSNNRLGYRVFRSTVSGGEGISISDFPLFGNRTFDVNVEPNTIYYYTIAEVLAEASLDTKTVELTPEKLGARSREVSVIRGAASGGGDGKPQIPRDTKKGFIIMDIGDPFMVVNHKRTEIDAGNGTAPIIQDGRTMVPIRAIIEAIGGTVEWNDAEKQMTLKTTAPNAHNVQMWIGKKDLLVDGTMGNMDIAPFINDKGRTLLPLRFVAENLSCQIEWVASKNRAIIVFAMR